MTQQQHHVLYVEDNETLQSLMTHIMVSCRVEAALTGEAAVEILDTHPTFDLVLVDINLGDGMDGIELCKLIRQRPEYKAVPVVALTAMDYARIGEHVHPDMFTACVTKPFKIPDIVRLRDQYLTVGAR